MDHNFSSQVGGSGRLGFGPVEEDRLVARTLKFICEQLPAWRDDPRRPSKVAEKGLNSSLCDFLDVKSRTHLPMARFKHEAPQAGRRIIDIGVHGLDEVTTIGTRSYGIYEPFLVIECKRLPSPGGKDREREYVSGLSGPNESPAGGIQRFKLGIHGNQVESAAIVGYIEKQDYLFWHKQINQWLSELDSNPCSDGTEWLLSEQLQVLRTDGEKTAWCESTHPRIGSCITPEIVLRHLWIVMK